MDLRIEPATLIKPSVEVQFSAALPSSEVANQYHGTILNYLLTKIEVSSRPTMKAYPDHQNGAHVTHETTWISGARVGFSGKHSLNGKPFVSKSFGDGSAADSADMIITRISPTDEHPLHIALTTDSVAEEFRMIICAPDDPKLIEHANGLKSAIEFFIEQNFGALLEARAVLQSPQKAPLLQQ